MIWVFFFFGDINFIVDTSWTAVVGLRPRHLTTNWSLQELNEIWPSSQNCLICTFLKDSLISEKFWHQSSRDCTIILLGSFKALQELTNSVIITTLQKTLFFFDCFGAKLYPIPPDSLISIRGAERQKFLGSGEIMLGLVGFNMDHWIFYRYWNRRQYFCMY